MLIVLLNLYLYAIKDAAVEMTEIMNENQSEKGASGTGLNQRMKINQ